MKARFTRLVWFSFVWLLSHAHPATATHPLAPPLPPGNLAGTVVSASQINVSWDASATATGYDLDYSTVADFSASVTTVADIAGTSSNVTGLTANTTYHFRVRAKNGDGPSPNSAVIARLTRPGPPTLGAFTNVQATSMTVNWTADANGQSGFELDRATDEGFTQNFSTTALGNVTTANVSGLSQNTTYHFRLRATNASGASDNSGAGSQTTLLLPPAAPNVSASAFNSSRIDLSWAGYSSNADNFDVQQAPSSGGPWTPIATNLAAGTTSYSATGLTDGTTYYFQVVARNAAGDTPSNIPSATTPLNPPSGLSATAISSSQINLSWTDNSGSETGYDLDRANDAGFTQNFSTVNVPAGTSFSVTGLAENTTYHFRLRAKNGTETSGNSNAASATTILNPPTAPTLQDPTVQSNTRIDLAWTNTATNAASNEVDVSTTADFSGGVTTTSVAASQTSFQATGLSGNTAYWFRVRAKNASGEAASNVKTATTLPNPPGEPQGFAASSVETTTLTLAWSAPVTGGAVSNYELVLPVPPGTVTQTGTTYNVTGLSPGTNYNFQVRAQNAGGVSNYANASALTKPGKPTNLQVSVPGAPTGINQLNLSWSSPGGVVSGYDVDQATTGTGPWTTIATDVAATNYAATGLTANTAYFFRVRAKNATGSSADSDVASNTTLPNPPAAPTDLTITTPVTSTSQLALTWTDNATNEVSYEVERSENGGGWSAIATGLAANTTGYTATGLNANTPYAFRVRAVNPGGPSAYSNEPSALTLPNAPGGLTATVPGPPTGITQINLSWSAPGGPGTLSGYKLDYSTSAGFSPVTTVDVAGTSHSLTGLTANTQYFFRVRAVNASGESANSGSANATTLPTPPANPTGLSATASTTSPNDVSLTWTDAATNETGYEVERSTNNNSGFAKIADLGANASSYTSGELSSNTTYFYRVRAKNTGGESGYSNEASALTIPDAPGSLSVSVPAPPDGITKLSLTWNAPSGTLSGYDLEYATNAGFTGSTVAAVPVGTSFTLEGLTQNTTYHLRLRAKNATGPSPNSNQVSATTLPNPPAVPALQATTNVSANGFTINWTAPGGPLTGYALDVATSDGFGATIVQSFTPGSGATSQPVGSLNANTTYYFRIKAINTGGESAFSAPAASQLTLPAAPDGFVVQGTPTVNSITLAWTALGSAVTDYELRYSTNPDPSGGTAVTVANNGSPYTVTGLSANTRYYFQLRARNATGLSAAAGPINALTLPAQPQDFAIQPGSVQATQVTVQWSGTSPNPDDYTLRYSTDPGLAGASSLTPGGGATNQSVSGLTPNTTYYFQLVANNATGASQATAIISQLTLPAAPTGLTVSDVTTTSLKLTWAAAPPSNPAGYELSISPNPGVTLPIALGGGDTSYDVTGLSQNTTYTFELRAKNATGLSAPASVQQLTKPNPPSGLAVQGGSVTDQALTLTWTPPGGSLEKYELYYSTNANAEGGTTTDVNGGASSAGVNGLSPNTTYFFKLRAKNATDFSTFSNIVQQLTFPATPTGLAVQGGSVTTTGLTLQWTALGGIDYELKYSTNPDGEGGSLVNITAPAAGTATQAITGLSQNTTYYFKLRAKNATGLSAPASVQQLTLPDPPTALSASSVTATSATIAWTPPGGSLTGYDLDYSTDNTFGSGVTTVTPDGGASSFNVGGLTANTTYHVRLRAKNATGTSAYSTTLTLLTRPAAPTNLVKLYANQTTIVVQWTPPGGSLTGYQLQVATDEGFASVAQTPTPGGGASTFTVTGLTQNTTYYLRIRAKNTGDETGYGEYSNVITVATPPNPPAAPVFGQATGLTQTSMFINWTPVTGGPVSGYSLEYSRFANFSPVDSIVINNGGAGQQQITGLTSKTIYYVRIRAFNAGGHSPYSSVQQVQTLPDPPTQPTNFQVLSFTQTTVSLSWVPPATADQTGYELLYSTDPTFSGTTPSVSIAGNATTYTLTGLQPFTTYYLRLRATNAGGGSIPAEANFSTLPNPPAAPTGLSASAITQTSFTLNWTAPTGPITGYDVQVATDAGFTNLVATATPDAAATSAPITGLTQNTAYFVRVRANNTGGQGAFSTPALAVSTLPVAPDAPTGLTASAVTAGGLTLTWTAPGGPITSYTLEYSTDNTFATGVTTLNPAGSATSQAITGLSANTTYHFRLKAVNAGGESPYATLAPPVTTLPGPPTLLPATAIAQTTLTLNWTAPGGTLTGYQLRYSTNPDPSGATPVAVDAGATSFAVTGLSQNTTYYFQLTALNGTGASLPSNVLSVQTLPDAPAAPTNLAATSPSQTGLTLTWTPPGGPIDGYTLEYSTDPAFASNVTTLNPAGSATSQAITGLTANTTYHFRLRATNAGGTSPNSAVLSLPTLPDAPTSLAVGNIAQTTLTLTWTAPGGTLTGYDLQRATDAGFTVNVTSVPVTGTPTTTDVGGLAANTTYFFRLRALNATGPSPFAVTNATTLPNAPAAPTALTASDVAQTTLTLNWTAPAGPVTSYTLDYSTDPAFASNVTTLNPAGSATSQAITGLSANTTYHFRLKATNAGGTSPEATAQVLTLPTLPGVPTAFAASAASSSQMNLSWTNGGGQTALELQYSTSSTFASNVQNVPVAADATSATVTGLAENTTYYFRLRGQNAGGFSDYALTQATTLLNPPAAPSNLAANATSSSQIQLQWADNAGTESGFYIEQATGGGSFAQIAEVGANTTSFTVSSLSENTEYSFRVRAFNASGTSAYSNTAPATTPFAPPGAPSNLQSGGVGQTTVELSWQDNAGNETGYEVEFSTDGTNFSRVAQLGANTTSFTVASLSSATGYSFRVRAVNPSGGSGYSNVVQVTTLPFPPQTPSSLSAQATGQTEVRLTWSDNSNNEDRFELERSEDGINFVGIGSPGANSTQAQATGLRAGTRYFFRLRAVNAGGASGYSNVAEATTLPDAPVAPSNLAAKDTTQTTLVLTWQDNANDETSVEVFQADSANGSFRRIAVLPANSTTHLVPTLLVNKMYRFRVRMVNGGGAGQFSNEISVQTLPFPPEAPTLVVAQTISQTAIRLRWRNTAGTLTQTRVEQSTDGRTFALAQTLAATVDGTNVENLRMNTVYYFRLQHVNRGGVSPYSAVVSDTTFGTIPAAPVNLRAENLRPRSVRLRWDDRSDNEARFEIEQWRVNKFERIANAVANADTFLLTGLTDQTEYRFRVRASNRTGVSAYTNELTITTPLGPPDAPVNLQFTGLRSSSQFGLKWTIPNRRATDSIDVEQSIDGAAFRRIQSLPSSADSTIVVGIQAGFRYAYRVRGINKAGPSGYSNVVERSTVATGLEPVASLSRVRVQPNPVENEVLVEAEDPKTHLRAVEVLNTLGQRVFRWEATGPERSRMLSLGDLPAGVYILSTETSQGVSRQKLLKR